MTMSKAPKMPYECVMPKHMRMPVVFSSPHSGTYYPAEFRALSSLDDTMLRRSEDAFVNELFAPAPLLGAPLLSATYARAYLDLNREPYELDPEMFEGGLLPGTYNHSERARAGLGTLARIVATGVDIYDRKLDISDAEHRIQTVYHPYHEKLKSLLDSTKKQFGFAILVECHSMPSTLPELGFSSSLKRQALGKMTDPDMVLGDLHGTSCAPEIVDTVEKGLASAGYRVRRNRPYAGASLPTGTASRHEVFMHYKSRSIADSIWMKVASPS